MAVTPQIIKIKRRVTGAAGAPSSLEEGEPAFNANGNTLHINNGTSVVDLVSASRQLELDGEQTIIGVKTIGSAGSLTTPIANFHIEGGSEDYVLHTDGDGTLTWKDPTETVAGSIEVNAPLEWSASDVLQIQVASASEINTGTDNVKVVTSAGLRSATVSDANVASLSSADQVKLVSAQLLRDIMGQQANAANLTTEATQVVPAIAEINGKVSALTALLRFAGSYNADDNEFTGAGPAAGETTFPAASSDNEGWVVIVTDSGTGAAPAPTVELTVGDWLISDGTKWVHLDLDLTTVVAANVSFIPGDTGLAATNVQDAIEEIFESLTENVEIDNVSIQRVSGVLQVVTVDGGLF